MAFFYIDRNATLPNPTTPQPISAGVVYESTAQYDLDNAAVSGDVIPMVPLPARARVCAVTVAAVGQAATVAVGDGDDPDRYITSGAVAAGAVARINAATAFGYSYQASDTVDVTLGATPVDGGSIFLTVLYVIE